MKKKLFFIPVCVCVIAVFISAFRAPSEKNYQHVIIIAKQLDMRHVFISVDGKEYKHQKLDQESKGDWDMNPLINVVHQYESEGWEMQNFASSGEFHTIWLKKEKS